jgi:1-deoxyxylulose-5-phosphate synthase
MIRMNQKGVKMDAEDFNTHGLGDVSEVVTHVKQVRKQGMGVISMKLVGEGTFTTREDRQAAMRFAFKTEAIENVNLALA